MVLVAAVEALNSTIGRAIGRLENILSTSEQAQKATLALGMSLEGGFKTLGGSMDDLNGTFGQTLQVGIASLNAGLQGNTKSILGLLNEQQLLGQDFKSTARTFARLEASLGLSREQSGDLVETLKRTSDTFGVSISNLVSALNALEKNLPVLRAAGLGGLGEAAVALQGQLGPALAKPLEQFFSFITDTSMQAYQRLSVLGVGSLREELAADGGDVGKMIQRLTSSLRIMDSRIRLIGGDLDDFYAGFSRATDLFGESAQAIMTIADNLDERMITQASNKAEFNQQIKVIIADIFRPFDEVIGMSLYPKLSELGRMFGEMFIPKAESLAKKFGDLIEEFVDFDKILSFTNKTIGFLVNGVNGLLGMYNVVRPLVPAFKFLLSPILQVGKLLGFLAKTLGKFLGLFVTPLDPENFVLQKQSTGYLKQIADNTDKSAEELKQVKDQGVPAAIQRSLEMLDATLLQISEEAVRDPLMEELVLATEATAINTSTLPDMSAETLTELNITGGM